MSAKGQTEKNRKYNHRYLHIPPVEAHMMARNIGTECILTIVDKINLLRVPDGHF